MLAQSSLTLPNDKIVALSESKPSHSADEKLKVAKMMTFVRDRMENIVCGKRKCWLPAFSPFPSVFSKGQFLRVVKTWNCVVNGYR